MLDALLSALTSVDGERATLYSDPVFAALPAATPRYLEALMSTGVYEPESEFVREYIVQPRAEARAAGLAEGRAQGRAEGVLAVLDARGITLDDATVPASPGAPTWSSSASGCGGRPPLRWWRTWSGEARPIVSGVVHAGLVGFVGTGSRPIFLNDA